MLSAIQQALAKRRTARSIDEGDEYAAELAAAAMQNIPEAIDLYYGTDTDSFALVWCLQGLTTDPVVQLFKDALRHRDPYVRWAAVEGLRRSKSRTLIPLFVKALKDPAALVKGVAVEWLTFHGDATAIGPLEHLSKLPSQIKHSPGTVRQAEAAALRLRAKLGRKELKA